VHTFESQAWVKQQVVLVESTQVAVEKKTKKMLDRRIQNDSGVCGPQQRSNAAMKTYPMLEATLTVDLTAWAIIEMLWGRERWASVDVRVRVGNDSKKIKCGLRFLTSVPLFINLRTKPQRNEPDTGGQKEDQDLTSDTPCPRLN